MAEIATSPARRAIPILASLVVLVVGLVVTSVYLLIALVSRDSAPLSQTGMVQAMILTMFCVVPLALGSIVVYIAKWRYARIVLAVTLVAGLVSVGYFVVILDRIGYF